MPAVFVVALTLHVLVCDLLPCLRKRPSCFRQSCEPRVSPTYHRALSVVVQANSFLLALEQSLREEGEEDCTKGAWPSTAVAIDSDVSHSSSSSR